MSSSAGLFPFVQLELAGTLGIADGRYLVRRGDEATEVVVVTTAGAPRRRSFGGRRPRDVSEGAEPEALPATRVTVVRADELGSEAEGARWLERTARDTEAADDFVDEGVRLINRALHAYRAAALDPYVHEITARGAAAIRIGYGSGDEVAAGGWSEARRLPRREPRRRRTEGLRPQERVAAVLGGRESVDACETLILRARLDLDQGRAREAALQLRTGLDALLAELPGKAGPGQEEDLAALSASRDAIAAIADEALRGELEPAQAGELRETLDTCERVLRRQAVK